jgi:hypothetical protein
MELRVVQSPFRDAVHGGRRNDAAERAGDPVTLIIRHDQQDVGRTLGRDDVWWPPRLGVFRIEVNLAAERRWRIGDVIAVVGSWRWANRACQ